MGALHPKGDSAREVDAASGEFAPSVRVPSQRIGGPSLRIDGRFAARVEHGAESGTDVEDVRSRERDRVSDAEDRDLMRAALDGDANAFEGLVEKYQDRAIAIARGFVRDREIARDVAQEAFLRVFRNLERFDFEQRFYTWFYRIVVHLAIDHLRRRRRFVPWKLNGTPHAEDRFVERSGRRIEDDERARAVERILARVPTKYRMLIQLREYEGFTSKEIADIAGWNHATVRWRLHRARHLFRDAWISEGLEPEV